MKEGCKGGGGPCTTTDGSTFSFLINSLRVMGVQYMVLDQEAVRPEWWSGEEGGAYARLASGGGRGRGVSRCAH